MIHIDPKKAVWPLGVATAFSLLGDATLYTVLPTHTNEVGIALASVGIILGINRAVRIFLNGPTGLIYDRMPRRWLFISGLLIGAISTALYAISHGLWLLLLGRLIWGMSWSLIWVGGTKMILDITEDQDRGHLMGLYQTWFFLGQALGALAGGVLTDLIGYSATMWAGTLLAVSGAITAMLFLPETKSFHKGKFIPVQRTGDDEPATAYKPKNGLWTAASVYGINRFVTAGVLSATLALLIQQNLNSRYLFLGLATVTGILMALRTVLSMFASIFSGTISDWMGSRWKLLNIILIMGTVGMVLLIGKMPIVLMIGVSLGAIAGGGLQTISSTLPGDFVNPHQQGAAIGVIHTSGDFGSAFGPPAAYALLPLMGLPGIYLLCAGLFLIQMIPIVKYQLAERIMRNPAKAI